LGIVLDRRFPVFSASCRDSGAVRDVLAEHGDRAYSSWAASASFKPRRLSRRFPALVAAFDGFRFRVSPFVLSIVFGPNLDELGIRGKQRPL
jgi:hypothetical protein